MGLERPILVHASGHTTFGLLLLACYSFQPCLSGQNAIGQICWSNTELSHTIALAVRVQVAVEMIGYTKGIDGCSGSVDKHPGDWMMWPWSSGCLFQLACLFRPPALFVSFARHLSFLRKKMSDRVAESGSEAPPSLADVETRASPYHGKSQEISHI